jgi:hypothetical protein
MTPAKKPSTPKMSGKGASAWKRVAAASTMPAPDHAAPQAKPIPIAPRMRRSHFRMIVSESSFARVPSPHSVAKGFVLQSSIHAGAIQARSSRV